MASPIDDDLYSTDDVAALDPLNDKTVVRLIQSRYERAPTGNPPLHHLIYTRAGPVIVAVNPLCNVKERLYTKAARERYHRAAKHALAAESDGAVSAEAEESEEPPHIYEVSAKAFLGVCKNRSQAIVINGESGAGKTETTKLLLEYLSEVSAPSAATATTSGGATLAAKLLASSPVLEAFGNAKTLRNDNSSRFGKLIKLHFAPADNALQHASVSHYLLEKSRVVVQEEGEQAYHAFYYLAACAPPGLRASLRLPEAASFGYLRPSDERLAVDFGQRWQEANASLATMLGCSEEDELVSEKWKV